MNKTLLFAVALVLAVVNGSWAAVGIRATTTTTTNRATTATTTTTNRPAIGTRAATTKLFIVAWQNEIMMRMESVSNVVSITRFPAKSGHIHAGNCHLLKFSDGRKDMHVLYHPTIKNQATR